jgi:uncharacterized protein YggT (Ycf19 family)
MSLWLFLGLNHLLAAAMYLLLGRLVLGLLPGTDGSGMIERAFVGITEPVVRVFRPITPRRVPEPLLLLFAALWLGALRFALAAGFSAAGLLSGSGG